MLVEFLENMTIGGTAYRVKQQADLAPALAWDLIEVGKVGEVGAGTFKIRAIYTDLVQSTAGINPPGLASDPTLDNTVGGFPGTYLFAGNAENILVGQWQVVHEWAVGTAIYPHIHWALTQNSANDPDWRFYYRVCGFGKAAEAWVGPVSATHEVASATADQHRLSSFGSIPLTDEALSVIVLWRLHRLGNTDANNDDARLLSIDAHYRKNPMWLGQKPLR